MEDDLLDVLVELEKWEHFYRTLSGQEDTLSISFDGLVPLLPREEDDDEEAPAQEWNAIELATNIIGRIRESCEDLIDTANESHLAAWDAYWANQ
jgi:hypothetical protein